MSPREVAGHLQVLALAEGHSLALGPLVAMVEGAQCVRQAMLQLQLYCQSGDAAQETQVKSGPLLSARYSLLSALCSLLSALCSLLSALLTPVLSRMRSRSPR